MPMFTIVGGVNGAGKSSLSGVLKDCLDDLGVIVDPDKITAQLGGDEYAGGQAAVAKLQDCLAQRIANRVAHGGHDIAAQDVERRFSRRFRDLAKLLPLCNEATFYDNNNGFRVVAFYRNGEIVTATETPPTWLLALRKEIVL